MKNTTVIFAKGLSYTLNGAVLRYVVKTVDGLSDQLLPSNTTSRKVAKVVVRAAATGYAVVSAEKMSLIALRYLNSKTKKVNA